MPIALITIGLLLVITGVKNTYAQFGAQLKNDFTGQNNFTTWLVAIGLIGAVGYVPALRAFSNGFLVLVFIVIVLKNGGAFDNLKSALAQGPVSTPANPPPVVPSGSTANDNKTAGVSTSDIIPLALALV